MNIKDAYLHGSTAVIKKIEFATGTKTGTLGKPVLKITKASLTNNVDDTEEVLISLASSSFATLASNTVLAGPTSGANAAPTFRALVSADIPDNAANTSGKANTAGTADLAGNISGASLGLLYQFASNVTSRVTNTSGASKVAYLQQTTNGSSTALTPTWVTAIAATSITEDDNHKFITAAERTAWNNVSNWYTSFDTEDSDTVINRWNDIVSFLNGITDDQTLSGILAGYSANTHVHGNITNGGALQATDITIANGDKLVVTDSSDNAKVARTSIAFDGTTTTQALTKAGTWLTFNNYSHPTGDGNLHVPATGTTSNNKFLAAGNAAESISWRALVADDIPNLSTAKLIDGTLGVARGGTGKDSWTQYDIVYASGTAALSQIAHPDIANGTRYLKCVTNASKVPTYSWESIENYTTTAATKFTIALSKSAWAQLTDTQFKLPTTKGLYALYIEDDNCGSFAGQFAVYDSSGKLDEIPLHWNSKTSTATEALRIYAATLEGHLKLASGNDTNTNHSLTIKYKRII